MTEITDGLEKTLDQILNFGGGAQVSTSSSSTTTKKEEPPKPPPEATKEVSPPKDDQKANDQPDVDPDDSGGPYYAYEKLKNREVPGVDS